MQLFANGDLQSFEEELAGKTIVTATVKKDRDPVSRGIGCRSRDRLTITFDDGSAMEFYVAGNFGLSVVEDVDVEICGVFTPAPRLPGH
jgi:hypothetical protein